MELLLITTSAFLSILVPFLLLPFANMSAPMTSVEGNAGSFTLDSVRDALIRIEDTVVFGLIERARFPLNPSVYDKVVHGGFGCSLLEFVVRETEAIHAKVGRYENPEERAFFPDGLPPSMLPPYNYSKELHPAAASINVNNQIWDMYVNQLLPLFCGKGDDSNYSSTAASDLTCLQALSRRIHYGLLVAEVKFRESQEDYIPAIESQDRDALMKLLTFESVEEMVKRRVEKKAMVFGQDVTLTDKNDSNYKIDPKVVSRLYGEWVMPLTKLVEVEYLLRRLD